MLAIIVQECAADMCVCLYVAGGQVRVYKGSGKSMQTKTGAALIVAISTCDMLCKQWAAADMMLQHLNTAPDVLDQRLSLLTIKNIAAMRLRRLCVEDCRRTQENHNM